MKAKSRVLAILLAVCMLTSGLAQGHADASAPPNYTQIIYIHVTLQGPPYGVGAYQGIGVMRYKFLSDSVVHQIPVSWDQFGVIHLSFTDTACLDKFFYWWEGQKWLSNDVNGLGINCVAIAEDYDTDLALTGDGTGDNIINILDFNLLKQHWATSCTEGNYDPLTDFNNDCNVNVSDYNWIKVNWDHAGFPAPW